MEDQIREIERKDGVRLVYNVFPMKPLETLPISVLYSPIQPLDEILPYEPVFCPSCRNLINPYCEMNYAKKSWVCVFCSKMNLMPANYSNVSANNLPPELVNTTVEYSLLKEANEQSFVFLIDTCFFDKLRMALVVDAVRVAYDLLPENSLICFVLFGTNINLLDYGKFKKNYVFSGNKKYEKGDLQKLFEKDGSKISGLKAQNFLIKRFFKRKNTFQLESAFENLKIDQSTENAQESVDDAKNSFNSLSADGTGSLQSTNSLEQGSNNSESLKENEQLTNAGNEVSENSKSPHSYTPLNTSFIQADPFPVSNGNRPLRCTGSALSFATSLIDSVDAGSKIFLFAQGPCTYGPGTTASLTLKDSIRSLSDIIKGKATYVKSAIAFYTDLANKMALQGTALDIFGATIEDIGVYEMKAMCDQTGGTIIMAQDFDRKIFISSIIKHLKHPELSYSHFADFEYPDDYSKLHRQLLGHSNTIQPMQDEAEEFTIHNKHTNEYTYDISKDILSTTPTETRYNSRIKVSCSPNIQLKGTLGPGINTGNLWRINAVTPNSNLTMFFEPVNPKKEEISYIQIISTTQKGRKTITRVSTIARLFNDDAEKIVLGFDQEAACVLQARLYTAANKFEDDMDLVRRIDRGLIRFVKRYATYAKNDPDTVTLPDTMSFFPNFMYFLRRSNLVQTEHCSPDEASYYRTIVSKERIADAMTVLYPVLTCYQYSEGIYPVEMDSKSLHPESILLLDTFSHVLIWKGEHISTWIKQGLHEQSEYAQIGEIVNMVVNAAKDIVKSRKPTPVFVVTEHGASQERILLSRVNPNKQGAHISTDDIDYDTFFRCLCKLVVDN